MRCLRGNVKVREELRVRFGYGASMPWMRQLEWDGGSDLVAVAGPDAVVRRGPRLKSRGQLHEATYTLAAGQSVDLTLTWFESHRPAPEPVDVEMALDATVAWWRKWAATCTHEGAYYDEVIRSLPVLRAIAGDPADVQIMYGLSGCRAAVMASSHERALPRPGSNWARLRQASERASCRMSSGSAACCTWVTSLSTPGAVGSVGCDDRMPRNAYRSMLSGRRATTLSLCPTSSVNTAASFGLSCTRMVVSWA